MTAIIRKEDQEVILNRLKGLPPSYILEGLNPEQRNHFFEVKMVCTKKYFMFKRLFSGDSPLEDLPDEDRELFGRLLDYYVTLYFVICWGWKDIETAFAKWHISYYTDNFPFDSPGETLAEILERHLAALFSQCKQDRFDFRPRKLYQLHLKRQKKNEGKLSNQAITQYERDAKTLAKPFESLKELEVFCVKASYSGAQERKDRFLKLKIQELVQKTKELDNELNRHLRNAKGYAWENGHKLETVKEGGTYKRNA